MNLKINSQKGQAVLEAVFVVSMLILVLAPALVGVAQLTYLKVLVQHQLYEYLICRETKFLENTCEQKLRAQLKNQLVSGDIKYFFHQKTSESSSAELILKTFYRKEIKILETVELPLVYAQKK